MTASMLVVALGAFFAGGAFSFKQQSKPMWSVLLLAAIAVALMVYGGYSWWNSR